MAFPTEYKGAAGTYNNTTKNTQVRSCQMNPIARRVQVCKLIERMNRDKEYAKKLGLDDVSEFKKSETKGVEEDERIFK